MCGPTLKQLGFIKTVSLVVAWGLGQTLQAQFVAFNEHQGGATSHSNTTLYSVRPPSATNAGFLKHIADGVATSVLLTVTNRPALSYGGLSAGPEAGTPAATVFGASVTFGNGYVQLSSNQLLAHVLTGLDPAKLYSLKGTAIRAGNADRWTLFELAEAVAFTSAHSAGCLTNGRAEIVLADNQVALCTGDNRAGDLFDWEDVQPGPTGTVVIYSKRFLGASVPGVFSNSLGTASYGLEALRVEERAPTLCSPPQWTAQPQEVVGWLGESASLRVRASGSWPLSYQWYRGPDFSEPIPNATNYLHSLASLTATDVGSYSVRITNACGFTQGVVAMLTVLTNPPVFTQTPTNLGVPFGSAALFSAAVTGSPPLFYQWAKDGTSIPAATNQTYSIAKAADADAGTYTLLASNRLGTASASATLTVFDLPLAITNPPLDQVLQPGSNVTFAVGVSGTRPTYQWYWHGTTLAGATNPTFTLTGVNSNQAGPFRVVVTNPLGSVTSAVAVLTIESPATPDALDAAANGAVWSLAVQADGKILLGGDFTTLGGQSRNYLGRLNPDGSLDAGFNPGANQGTVLSLTVQNDGQILVTGGFTTLAGHPRQLIGRLAADGTLDASFNPGVDNHVRAVALQADGKILLGGVFSTLAGQPRSRLGRLLPDGTLDPSFNPGADGVVYALLVQTDGKILVGGGFATLAGAQSGRLGRLNPDGTLDASFQAAANDVVWCMVAQPDGKLLVGGAFTQLSGLTRSRLGRLLPDGSVEGTFNPGADGTVFSLAVQTDGRILAGGEFGTLGGQARSHLGRLNSDGSLDGGFSVGTDYNVYALGMQGDGSILVGGDFYSLVGQARTRLGRLRNTQPGTQSFTVDGSKVTWLRQGTCPEFARTVLEVSTNAGFSWASFGSGVRGRTDWIWEGVGIPPAATVRARGWVSGGRANASGWFIEALAGLPYCNEPWRTISTRVGPQIVLTMTAGSDSPVTYQWQKDGLDLVESSHLLGVQSNVLVLTSVQVGDAGHYSVTVRNASGAVSRAAAQVTVVDPFLATQPTDQFTFVGSNALFTVGVIGTPPLSYQWYQGTTLLPWASADTLTLTNLHLEDSGSQYRVVVSNSSGSLTSTWARLAVFTPAVPDAFAAEADGTVFALAQQPNGQILVGGDFMTLGGQSRNRLGRLNPDGSVDPAFDPKANNSVYALALQADGKVVVAGQFTILGGTSRHRLGRLNPDGSLDAAFDPNADGPVQCMVLQPDGRILIGGAFTNLAGQPCNHLGRLNSDGSLDSAFNPGTDGTVTSLALQPDGKFFVGGNFSSLAGQPSSRLGRLHPDGSLDATFVSQVFGTVSCLALQTDGRALVGADVGTVGSYVARFNPDGNWDTNFLVAANRPSVTCLAVQADGKVLVGGGFTSLGERDWSGLGRLNPDGTLDPTFNPGSNGPVSALTVQADGKVLVGGAFTILGGQARSRLGRLSNTAVAQQSLASDGPDLVWQRGGTSPEVWRTTCELSSDGGTSWTNLGAGVRVPGGWRFSEVNLLSGSMVRARGFVASGYLNASGGLVETYLGLPLMLTPPQTLVTNAGAAVVLRVTAEGTLPLTWQWRRNGVDLAEAPGVSGTTSNVLVLDGVGLGDSGAYAVVLRNSFGSVTGLVATLTVLDPMITTQPTNPIVWLGSNALFSVVAVGTSPLRYQWFRASDPVPEATSSSLLVTNAQRTDDGALYSVVVTDASGSVTSAVALLSVISPVVTDAFNPEASGPVRCLAVQPDGKVLLGGDFATLGGQSRRGLGRVLPDGSLDSAFQPKADNSVFCVALQTDGRILVGGAFTTLGGQARQFLGRLNPDGSLDASFNPGANYNVWCLVAQADGRVLVGGQFTSLGGQPHAYLGRLNTDGSVDGSFTPGANAVVYCLRQQPDGRIVAGGGFTTLAGQARGGLGRLNPDGSLDATFDAQATATVSALAVQADGRILLGGSFTSLGGVPRNGLGRLEPDGSLDLAFNPTAGGEVASLAVQTDGRVLVAGNFMSLAGRPRQFIGRLNGDGTVDATFNPGASYRVYALGIQGDGSILAGGDFTSLGTAARLRVGRLSNTSAARQSLGWTAPSLRWSRGGPSPEVWRTTAEVSTDAGLSWASWGAGARVPGGWEWNGLPALPNATVRARGFLTGGNHNGSEWFVEAFTGWPCLISQPRDLRTNAGVSLVLAPTVVGGLPMTFQWQKDGLDLVENLRCAGTVSNVLVISALQASDAGAYVLVVSNSFGIVSRSVLNLAVVDPAITNPPASRTVWLGTNTVFSVGAAGTAPLTYQWYRGGVPLPGATHAALTLTNLQWADDASEFSVVVANGVGSVTSAVARLTVITPAVPDSLAVAANNTVCAALVHPDGTLWIGGAFTTLAGQPHNRLGRLNPEGSLDLSFNLGADDTVCALALQPDRALLVAGQFTALGDEIRLRLARLMQDGTLDSSFAPAANNAVVTLAVQPDGQILVGGTFTTLDGQPRSRLGRLRPDGSLDLTFNPGADSGVCALALQPDGRILVAGSFTNLAGHPCNRLGRLHPDGTFDSSFAADANAAVYCLAMQPDGRILAGGSFTTLAGQPHKYLGRLHPDGTLDTGFTPEANVPSVTAFALQTDGKILVGGTFTTLGGVARNHVGRLYSDGRVDATFDPGADGAVYALTLQSDGKVIMGGDFSLTGGGGRSRLVRLNNTVPATQALTLNGNAVTWLRGGASPEVWRTTLESSTNSGASWTEAGTGVRLGGGWEFPALAGLPNRTVRARGFAAGGYQNGSGGLMETIAGAPCITTLPQDVLTNAGAIVVLRAAAAGTSPLTWQWQKDGLDLVEGGPFTGTQSNVLVLAGVQLSHTGTYSIIVDNSLGQVTSVVAHLTVADPLITIQPANQTAWLGSNAVFTVATAGTVPLSFQWYEGPVPLPGATFAELTITNVQLADGGGEYWVEVSNASGRVASSVAVLAVLTPVVPDSLTSGANSNVFAVVVQVDGKMIVGGEFTSLAGQPRHRLGRLNADGSLDPFFNPDADHTVSALALQPDGSILVAGRFTTLGGQAQARLARLKPDGSLDAAFNPGLDGSIESLALQADGRILLAGSFTNLAGQLCNRLDRLNSDGSLDPTFHSGATPTIYALAVQPDGRILVGGSFTNLAGRPCNRLGRLNSDGSPDTTFVAEANGTVWCLALQPDGRILVGGDFTTLDGVTRGFLGRLKPDGGLDAPFNPGVDRASVLCLALQTDGGILVGGQFNALAGQSRSRLGRLNADGSLDRTFNPGSDGAVSSLLLQSDGKVVVAGSFATLGGQPRSGLGRLDNTTAADQHLAWSPAGIRWMRAGTSPEVWRTTVEVSTDGGASWAYGGAGVRVPGGWEFFDVECLPGIRVRTRGFVAGGFGDASGWFVETLTGPPFITTQPQTVLTNAGSLVVFAVDTQGTLPLTCRWQKDGEDLAESARFIGTSSNVLAVADLRTAETGAYSVVVSNVFGSVTGLIANLTVADPLITGQPLSQIAWLGTNLVLRVAAAGTAPLSYQWYRGSDPLPWGTAAVLTITNVTWSEDGSEYGVVVGNGSGSVTSAVARLSVLMAPVPDSLDANASGGVSCTVLSLAVQADAKILVGGDFLSLGGLSRKYLGRLNRDGSLDAAFNPAADNRVYAMVAQTDGKLLVGGSFVTLFGQTRSGLGQLNADGTLDASFNPGVNNTLRALVAQADGRILAGGDFTNMAGQARSYLGRLNDDGSLDTGFNPGANGPVYALAVQPDGKILVGGAFTTLAGQPREHLGRLNRDGSLDSTFDPGAAGTVRCFILQPDGQILVGGDFTVLGGQPRGYLGRLKPDGNLDSGFDSGANAPSVTCFALQTDGKILVGGGFTGLAGQPRNRLGRLNADGSLDNAFNPGANNSVYALGVQADGAILVGGSFTNLAGQIRGRMGRLSNTVPATESFAASGSALTWLRGGAGPEVWRTTFELSTNGGTSWVSLGAGMRVAGGWGLDGVTLPSNASIRLRGFTTGGNSDASGWFIETLAAVPRLSFPPLVLLTNAGAVVVLAATVESASALSCQWRKDGVDLADSVHFFGARASVLVITNVQPADAGTYSVVLSNLFGTVTGLVAHLAIADPLITSQPANFEAFLGQDALFAIGAAGSPPLHYQWYKEGVPLPGRTASSLIVTNVRWTDDGSQYRVVVSNLSASVTSAPALLIVAVPPGPDLLNSSANGTVWCLVVQGDGKIVVGGDFTSLGGQPRSYLGRLNADGSLDPAFTPVVDRPSVLSLGVQPDGKILVGGAFSSLGGQSRNRIARLHPDGTLDPSFNPGADGTIWSVVLQPDGKLLLGGDFRTLAGQTRDFLGRLNADGTLDNGFHPGTDASVYALAAQPDGRILVGGRFTTLAAQPCVHLGRLNPDGSLENTFGSGANGTVRCLVVQTDEHILVGGEFTTLGGLARNRLGRLHPDGSPEASFNPGVSDTVYSLALQADGKLLVAGAFQTLAGQDRSRLGRLHPDGSLDSTFALGVNNTLYALGVQADGKVLVGGYFTVLGGQSCSCVGRVNNTLPATQSLACNGSLVTWTRGGAGPEVWRTTFEVSTDNGATWALLGSGSRRPGGWQLSGENIPPSASVRARGFVAGGADNGSGWFVETILGPVTQPRFDTGLSLQFSGGQFHLRLGNLPALPGRVVLEASSDLRTGWTPILTNSTPVDVLDYVEPVAAGQSQRFYRAVWLQP